jgi:hypothetical protein
MPIYTFDKRNAEADMNLGLRVDRAAAVVAAGTNNIFTVVGRVLLTAMLGEVTVTIDGALTTLQITHLRTGVTTPTVTPLSIASGSTAGFAPGRMFTLPNAVGSAVVLSTGSSAALMNTARYYLGTGGLQLVAGGGATTNGLIKWSVWYLPVDDGAYMAAA